MYETLMPRALGGAKAAAHARRCWVAEALGVSEKTVDGARRELLADIAPAENLIHAAQAACEYS
jgi:hypothetical protein